jgi:hypothetical protein
MELLLTHHSPERDALPRYGLSERGQWPASTSDLPLFLTQGQLAHLLDKSVRTLERDRHEGRSIPFKKVGRTVLYARDDILAYRGLSFTSTRDAKVAGSRAGKREIR